MFYFSWRNCCNIGSFLCHYSSCVLMILHLIIVWCIISNYYDCPITYHSMYTISQYLHKLFYFPVLFYKPYSNFAEKRDLQRHLKKFCGIRNKKEMMNGYITKPRLPSNHGILGLILFSHIILFMQEANSSSYIIGNRPYARSLQSK